MSSNLAALDPRFAPLAQWFVDAARAAGFNCQVTSTLRSSVRQQELYDEWLAGKRDLPVLPPGHSLHERGLAFDMVVSGDYLSDDQRVVGEAWQQLGGTWGGVAGDPVHFQPPRWWLDAL